MMKAQFLVIGIALVGLLPGCAAVAGAQQDKIANAQQTKSSRSGGVSMSLPAATSTGLRPPPSSAVQQQTGKMLSPIVQ